MPAIKDEKTLLKLSKLVRSYNRIKYRIRNQVESVERIKVPKAVEGCEAHARVETYKTILTNENYINEQLKTEDGKDNLLFLLHNIEVAAVSLRKEIRDYESKVKLQDEALQEIEC